MADTDSWREDAVTEENRVHAIQDRRTLTDKVYYALREMILSGVMDDGERIVIDRVARLLSVSATPVREALARLVSEGLVQNEGYRGYVVAAVWDASAFDQMQVARMVVESYSARVAARLVREGLAPGLVDELEYHVGQMNAIVESSRQRTAGMEECRQYARSDGRFHQAIMDTCANTPLSGLLRRLRLQPHLTRVYRSFGNPPDAAVEHEEIVRRIREGSEELAAKAMEHHLFRSDERLRQFVARSQSGTGETTQAPPES